MLRFIAHARTLGLSLDENQCRGRSLGVSSIQRFGAVDILRFASATIEIDAAESVTWVNKDINAPHTAGSLLSPGFVVTRQVTFTFLKPGIYHYICVLHDDLGMKGTVIVRAED